MMGEDKVTAYPACKNSGVGYIQCSPAMREKYAKVCKHCSRNRKPVEKKPENGFFCKQTGGEI